MALSLLMDFARAHDLLPPVWLVRPSGPDDLKGVFDPDQTLSYQPFKPASDALVAQGFAVADTFPPTCKTAVVQITRSKQETLGLVAAAYQRLSMGGHLIVWGAKTDGIESLLKQIRAHLPAPVVASKNHGKFITLSKDDRTVPVLHDWERNLAPQKRAHGFLTQHGQFSPDKVDKGSLLLSEHCNDLTGKVADFGAGWGWLSATLLAQNPDIETLDLIEAEKTALTCAQSNITDPRAGFHWLDIQTDGLPGPYNNIVMNPPFHQGRQPDLALGLDFIRAAARNLTPKGTLLMVANRQLRYEQELTALFDSVEQLDQSDGFKVIAAKRSTGNNRSRSGSSSGKKRLSVMEK